MRDLVVARPIMKIAYKNTIELKTREWLYGPIRSPQTFSLKENICKRKEDNKWYLGSHFINTTQYKPTERKHQLEH